MTKRTNKLILAAALVIAAGIGQAGAFSSPPAPAGGGDSLVVLAQPKKIYPRASTSMRARLNRAAPISRIPGALADASNEPVAILKEDCQFANDSISHCIVWDCDDEDICVEYGQYCVDGDKVIPCP